jgi:hypothetical protein
MIVFRVLALVSLALLSFSTGCDSASVSRPADPTATPTLTRTPTSTRTFPVAPTSTPAPTNTVPTLFTPSPTPTATAVVPTATATPTATEVVTPTATPTGARVEVSRAIVDAEDAAFVDIVLATGGSNVGGMQNDLLFDNTIVRLTTASRCRINAEIGDQLPNCELDPQDITAPCKTLARNLVQCGSFPQPDGCPDGARASTSRFRAIIAATAVPNDNGIPDGTLYTCEFEVIDRSRLPQAILNRNLIVADPSGVRLDQFAAGDGLITAAARTSATALQGANELLIYPEDASRFPATGAILVLDQVVGFNRTGTRLSLFAPLAQIVPADSLVFLAPAPATPTRTATPTQTPGSPTSTPSHTPTEVATDVPTATMVAETPTPVPTFTATAVPTDTPQPTPTATAVPTDTPLPTATATTQATDTPVPTSTATAVPTVSATPTGTGTTTPTVTATPAVPTASATVASTATASVTATATVTLTALPTATATATATPVDTPTPAAVVAIVSADAAAGQVVIDVRLDAPGGNVGGVQNDILFDNTILGLPSVTRCRINPAIGTAPTNCEEDTPLITEPCKTLSRLIVTCGGNPQPNGCPDDADTTVSRFRAVIGATAVPNQNPIPDGVLYTCTFDVLNAEALPTTLQATKVVAADAAGGRIEPAVGVDGEARP